MDTPESLNNSSTIITKKIETQKGINEMQIEPQGGKITTLRLGVREIIIPVVRGDGKTVSTHVCTPNFGSDNVGFDLPQHGPARNAEWKVVDQDPQSLVMEYEIVGGNYPQGLAIEQKFALSEEGFALTTTHRNKGREPLPVAFAQHFYWNAPESFEGITVNGNNIAGIFAHPAGGFITHKTTNLIHVPGVGDINLKLDGLRGLYGWVGRGADGLADNNYVCIEPLEGRSTDFFGTPESMISPNQSRTNTISISLALG